MFLQKGLILGCYADCLLSTINNDQQKPRWSMSKRGFMDEPNGPTKLDMNAKPSFVQVALLSDSYLWSGGVMFLTHPPYSLLYQDCDSLSAGGMWKSEPGATCRQVFCGRVANCIRAQRIVPKKAFESLGAYHRSWRRWSASNEVAMPPILATAVGIK